MNAPYVICSECGRRLCGYHAAKGGYHVLPHKAPTGAVCPGRLTTEHKLDRPALL